MYCRLSLFIENKYSIWSLTHSSELNGALCLPTTLIQTGSFDQYKVYSTYGVKTETSKVQDWVSNVHLDAIITW